MFKFCQQYEMQIRIFHFSLKYANKFVFVQLKNKIRIINKSLLKINSWF